MPAAIIAPLMAVPGWAQTTILNVSYDPTRELYREFNAAFTKYWQAQTGNRQRTHVARRSGSQARYSVIDGFDTV